MDDPLHVRCPWRVRRHRRLASRLPRADGLWADSRARRNPWRSASQRPLAVSAQSISGRSIRNSQFRPSRSKRRQPGLGSDERQPETARAGVTPNGTLAARHRASQRDKGLGRPRGHCRSGGWSSFARGPWSSTRDQHIGTADCEWHQVGHGALQPHDGGGAALKYHVELIDGEQQGAEGMPPS